MASVAPTAAARAGWVVDQQFLWLVTILFVVGYSLPSLPSGLVFPSQQRLELADDPLSGGGVSFLEMWLPIISLSSWVVLRRYRLLIAILPSINQMLLLLLTWILLTSLWAPHPAATMRQAFSIIGVTVLSLAFVLASWHRKRFMGLLLPVTTALLVASLFVGLFVPAIGIQPEDAFELAGSWRGISYQKNGLGQLAAVGAILWAHVCVTGSSTRPRLAYAGLGLSFLLIILSRSSTSLALSIISIGVMVLVLRPPVRFNGRGGQIWLGFGVVVLASMLLYLMFIGTLSYDAIATPVASIFGKDATFSGRTLIWTELFSQIGKHPLLGIGFNSFWGASPDSPSAETIRRLQWRAPSGHNGYIDMINEIGLIGFVIFIGFLVFHFGALKRLAKFDRPAYGLHLTLIVYVILANLTETGWFHPILLTHVIAMYSSAEISRRLFEYQWRPVDRWVDSNRLGRPTGR
jgi:O-antigen ligase